ncbi:uncharacterized protein EDB91DRAFT_1077382 [Suillus paluster]|uniref:uncharacterized protein n=1 Tax=Suillus paluster TaxID=48578 RepID=UPI001B86FEF0|nr:uncharacterized protein EDB91DRAFT_1077382 [Suillus paluster]KAG1753657.1 hypothetical protein EDB91DRAFT_1077382 [Suillus paluster]
MAESDYRLFQQLLVGHKLPALQQDAEYLEESHDSELESLATADEQLYQISSISLLARKYVSHRLPNSSDTEYEPGEEAYKEEQSDNGSVNSDYGDLDAILHHNLDEQLSAAISKIHCQAQAQRHKTRHTFRPQSKQPYQRLSNIKHWHLNIKRRHLNIKRRHLNINAGTISNPHLNPSTISNSRLNLSTISNPCLNPQYHQQLPPQPQYHQQQLPHQPQYHQQPLPLQYHVPAPQNYGQPQPRYHQQPELQQQHTLPDQYHAERNEDRAVAEAYAGAFALLRSESSRLPSQSDSVQDGPLAPWGAARLVALAPLHPGENIHGERTQGVIRTQKHAFDTGKRQRNVRLPPTPEIPLAVIPDPAAASNSSASIADPPVSRCIKFSITSARRYKEATKDQLRGLILNVDPKTDGAPNDELRNKMISTALQIAKTKTGQAEIEDIKGINNYMVASLADMRRSFKSYAMNTVLVGYGLHLPLFSEEDKLAHKQDRVKTLLKDLKYMHQIEQAHQTSHFVDVSVNSPAFDDAYHEIIAYITTTIHASDTLCERFDAVQQAILK